VHSGQDGRLLLLLLLLRHEGAGTARGALPVSAKGAGAAHPARPIRSPSGSRQVVPAHPLLHLFLTRGLQRAGQPGGGAGGSWRSALTLPSCYRRCEVFQRCAMGIKACRSVSRAARGAGSVSEVRGRSASEAACNSV
jgi:hypothetical protein